MSKRYLFNQTLTDYAGLDKDQKYSVNEICNIINERIPNIPEYRYSLPEEIQSIFRTDSSYTYYRSALKGLIRKQVVCPDCPKSLTKLDKHDTGNKIQLLVI